MCSNIPNTMQRRTLSEDSNLKQLVKLLLRTDNGEPEALSDNLVSANFRYKSYPFDHLKRFKAIGPTQQAIVALSLIKEAIFDGLLAKKNARKLLCGWRCSSSAAHGKLSLNSVDIDV